MDLPPKVTLVIPHYGPNAVDSFATLSQLMLCVSWLACSASLKNRAPSPPTGQPSSVIHAACPPAGDTFIVIECVADAVHLFGHFLNQAVEGVRMNRDGGVSGGNSGDAGGGFKEGNRIACEQVEAAEEDFGPMSRSCEEAAWTFSEVYFRNLP